MKIRIIIFDFIDSLRLTFIVEYDI